MRELHVVSVSEDGRHVLLNPRRNAASGQFRVALDERLEAALRGELVRPGQIAVVTVPVTPKQIQSRLRAGESSAQIAASAGVPVARVERFAGPVLSEREGVISGAQSAVLDRNKKGRSQLPLGEAVVQHLAGTPGYKPESTSWSARREETGVWLVQLSYVARARQRTATWRYDPVKREVSALDGSSASLAHIDPAAGVRIAARPAAAPRPTRGARSAPAATQTRGGSTTSSTTAPDRAAGRRRVTTAGAAGPDVTSLVTEPSARSPRSPKRASPAPARPPRQGVVPAPAKRTRASAPSAGVAAQTRVAASARVAAQTGVAASARVVAEKPAAAQAEIAEGAKTRTGVPARTAARAPARATAAAASRASRTTTAAATTARAAGPAPEPQTSEQGAGRTAEGPSRPPVLRVVPPASGSPESAPQSLAPAAAPTPPVEAPPAKVAAAEAMPVRRAAGGRASVPAWADVLLGTGPRAQPPRDTPPDD